MAHLTGVSELASIHAPLSASIAAAGVYPNLNGVAGAGELESVTGALESIVLVVAVLMIVVCAAAWAVCSSHGNYHAAGKARTGLLVALGAAVLDGAGIAWINFLLHIGPTL